MNDKNLKKIYEVLVEIREAIKDVHDSIGGLDTHLLKSQIN